MNTCYDCVHPLKRIRTSLFVMLATALGVTANAQPWQAVVHPPIPGLPVVTVEVGYPHGYLPARNTPIGLLATAANVPFDGYIGFHFAVNANRTLDTPVLARVRLAPHQSWSFTTMQSVRIWGLVPKLNSRPREIVIEWRDPSMVVHQATAGAPPWSIAMPLRVGIANEVFGSSYATRPEELSARAQWYAGFTSVIVPLATWLDLPKAVRDAIFGSGVRLVFVGFPRTGQTIDSVTRAMMPVVFASSPGSYAAVWPYRESGPVATPVSWAAKQGAGYLGSPQCPYIARTFTIAWVADENALAQPLPWMVRTQTGHLPLWDFAVQRSGWLEEHLALLGAAVALLLIPALWILVRRDHFAFAAAIVLAVCATLAFARDRMRARDAVIPYTYEGLVGPDIAVTLRDLITYGAVPLHAPDVPADYLTGDLDLIADGEVRTPATPPSMGAVLKRKDWGEVIRRTYRRHLANARTPQRLLLIDFGDLHGTTFIHYAIPADNDRRYVLEGYTSPQPDRRFSAYFALPRLREHQTVVISTVAALAGGPVELAWKSGKASLTLTRKDVYTSPSCAIPPEILRAIDAAGGVFRITLTPLERTLNHEYSVRIAVQEKTS